MKLSILAGRYAIKTFIPCPTTGAIRSGKWIVYNEGSSEEMILDLCLAARCGPSHKKKKSQAEVEVSERLFFLATIKTLQGLPKR
jgi:hypothetical protein